MSVFFVGVKGIVHKVDNPRVISHGQNITLKHNSVQVKHNSIQVDNTGNSVQVDNSET